MKSKFLDRKGHLIVYLFVSIILTALVFSSCRKEPQPISNNTRPSAYPSHVLDKWMTIQLRLMRNATGIANHAFSRHFAYAGIAALESLSPGLHGQGAWTDKWNGLTGLPVADHSKNYYYPANVNAALASINKALFPNASIADKMVMDSLEAALNESFISIESPEVIIHSANFGKAVATAVFNWAETDGYKNANNAYTIPVGAGLWKPTPPAYANPATPYWGDNRTIIRNSIKNSQPVIPISYSTTPGSPFYEMVKQVYDASQVLTDDQKAMATFWRDVPGATSPGHWLSILQQVVKQANTPLDKGALAYALIGAAGNDGLISCFKSKYQHNLVRPVTFIREVMGHSTWNSYLTTPAHPEYSSAHASLSVAAAAVMQQLFSNIGSFTDRTYDYLGYAPRTYSSLIAIGIEAAQSRFYAGIHYQPSIQAGIVQGGKVAANIFEKEVPNYMPGLISIKYY